MRGIFSIARAELARRWLLVVIGFVLGLVPQLFNPIDHASKLSETLAVLGIVLSWTIVFAVGMSLVGRPLHDGKLSFYFARPIAAHAIAAGKILGGVLAITAMEVAVALPQMGLSSLLDQGGPRLAIGLALIGNGFLAVGLVVGILARSRARWFVVDAVGGTLAALASVAMFAVLNAREVEIAKTLDYEYAMPLLERAKTLLWFLVELAALVLVVAVVVAIARGRTDRERVHRVLSFTLWPALTVLALGGLVFARWGLQ